MKTAKFITLEGMDGAGKSTHIPTIIATLQSRGHEVVSTREPGGTVLGERLRELLLHENMHAETETLLMFAARREHIATVIAPALDRGAYVLSDRFTDATFAYQSGAKGVSAAKVELLEQWVQGDLQPDLTLLFDVPVEISMQRLAAARSPDKFEREDAAFFTRIRQAYLQRAQQNPARFRIIDGSKSLDKVKAAVEEIISKL
jgi:dTMP kinase